MSTQKRGKQYYSRVRIPADLRQYFPQAEIVRSLRTRYYRTATTRCALWEARVAGLFCELRRHMPGMTPQDAKRLIDLYISRALEEGEQDRARRVGLTTDGHEAITDGIGEALQNDSNALAYNDLSRIGREADDLLEADGKVLDRNSEEYRRFCRELLKARIEVLRTELARWNGEYEDTHPVGPVPTTELQESLGHELLSVVIQEFVREKETGGNWAPRTATMFKSGLQLLLEIVGDKPIGEVSKADLRHYKEVLHQLPINMSVRYPGLSVKDVLKLNDPDTLSDGSVDKQIRYLKSLFIFAVDHDYIDRNPAVVIKGSKTSDAREERRAFDPGDLKAIFESGYATEREKRPERYWIPLILLHTGARLEEIAQLDVEDIRVVDGVPVFDIRSGTSDKNLKTATSARIIPVHSWLIAQGFLKYVENVRAAGETKLWPGLKKTANGYGSAISKWFNRRLRSIGISDEKKVLYSTRHTVATALKGVDVQDSRISDLLGHAVEGQTFSRYGKRLEIAELKKVVEKLKFDLAF